MGKRLVHVSRYRRDIFFFQMFENRDRDVSKFDVIYGLLERQTFARSRPLLKRKS